MLDAALKTGLLAFIASLVSAFLLYKKGMVEVDIARHKLQSENEDREDRYRKEMQVAERESANQVIALLREQIAEQRAENERLRMRVNELSGGRRGNGN